MQALRGEVLQAPPSLSQKATTAATTMATTTAATTTAATTTTTFFFLLAVFHPSFFLLLLLSLRLGGIWNSWEHREKRERGPVEPQKGQCSAGFIPVGSEIPFEVQLAGCLVQAHMHTHLRLPGRGNPQSRAKNLEGQRWAPWQCLKLAHQARFCKPLPRLYAFDNCKERNQVCFAMADPKYPRLRASSSPTEEGGLVSILALGPPLSH